MKKIAAIALLSLTGSVFANTLEIHNASPFEAKYPLFNRAIHYQIQFQGDATVDAQSAPLTGVVAPNSDVDWNVVDKNGQSISNYVADIKLTDSKGMLLGTEHIANGQATFNIAIGADTSVLRDTGSQNDMFLTVQNWYVKS